MPEETKKEAVPVEGDESVFEDAAVEEQLPAEMEMSPEDEEELGVFEPTISSESPKAKLERKGVKEKADGRVVTIKQCFFTRPKIKAQDGSTIPPKLTQTSQKPFYSGKLGVRFEEDNLVEYYPTMRYFVNDNKVSLFAKLNRTGESAIKLLVDMVIKQIGKPADEVSDKEILDYLVGKKVKLTTKTGTYKGRAWFRNDILEFVA